MKQFNGSMSTTPLRSFLLTLLLMIGSAGLAACDFNEGTAEEAGEEIEQAADKAANEVEEAAEAMQNKAEDMQSETDSSTNENR